MLGTHDIQGYYDARAHDITVNTAGILYSEYPCATGALVILVFITESRDVDFTKSVFLALSRTESSNYTLPFNLSLGQYKILAYDIEIDGTLDIGVGYSAIDRELVVNRTIQGSYHCILYYEQLNQ